MGIVHLYDHATGPAGVTGGYTVSFELGVAFTVSAGCAITGLRWLSANGTVTDKPAALRIWDTTDGHLVASTSVVPHNGSTNVWQDAAFAAPFSPVVGRTYRVTLGL